MYRILFLEDEELLVEDLPLALAPDGFEVVATNSVTEALEYLKEEPFDVVLLDIMMPVPESLEIDPMQFAYGRETGVAVAKLMKAIKPTTPIVAFTVLTDPEIRSRMREAGIKRVITKPSEISTMVSALTEAIKYQV